MLFSQLSWTGGVVEGFAEFLFEVVFSVSVALSVDFNPGDVINWRLLIFGLQTHLVEQATPVRIAGALNQLVDDVGRGVSISALVQFVDVKALLQAGD
ncbi:hypothetical protein T4A_424 [Trichinella pseudospiralis]|uniref:Uncharacterized protein n=1 Tax=Trichinella pseudospiralis TaxID=6337 RepID=A0A0V1EXS0_TRIPS|nr:hypothetical protein T4A_424 [Trichinella pseudospiralis]KRY92363.1 hypothetical protein T4D_10704 [Trichinella pseudospiralis]KRZ46096.1 hypothetical protein T4C_9162 [Trichinella pseudospiralis]